MDLASLNPSVLRELLELSEEKNALVKKIEAIDSRITALSSGKATVRGRKRGRAAAKPAKKAPKTKKSKPAARAPRKKRGKRGALKNDILALLSQAGPEGISVKDISSKLGVKNQNVHVWFSTTGKKMPEVTKVGEARYAIASAS